MKRGSSFQKLRDITETWAAPPAASRVDGVVTPTTGLSLRCFHAKSAASFSKPGTAKSQPRKSRETLLKFFLSPPLASQTATDLSRISRSRLHTSLWALQSARAHISLQYLTVRQPPHHRRRSTSVLWQPSRTLRSTSNAYSFFLQRRRRWWNLLLQRQHEELPRRVRSEDRGQWNPSCVQRGYAARRESGCVRRVRVEKRLFTFTLVSLSWFFAIFLF
jgi:hypothetical protein